MSMSFDDELKNVSGGVPNPASFKIDECDLTESEKNDEYFMHWWRVFNDKDIEQDRLMR